MAGLVPATHAAEARRSCASPSVRTCWVGVDDRDKPGHDAREGSGIDRTVVAPCASLLGTAVLWLVSKR